MKLAPLLLGLALASCALAPTRDPLLGEPLVINGKSIGDDELELALIYGPGKLLLDVRTMGLFVEAEIARQIETKAEAEVVARETALPFPDAAARKRAKQQALADCTALLRDMYRITDAEFEAEYKYNVDDFRKSYPTLDIDTEIARAFRSVGWYRTQLRGTMQFDRVFLPPNPDEWPATSVEAVRTDPAGGGLLIPDAKQSYQARLEAAEKHKGEMPREDPLYMTFLRQIVRDALLNTVTIKKHADGIRDGLALWVDTNGDGKPELELTIDELWREVRKTISATDIDEVKRWFVTSRATHDRLEKDGALLPASETRNVMNEVTSGSDSSTITLEQTARQTYYFPSVEAFTEYWTMREGFRRRIAHDLETGPGGELSPALREHLERANLVMGLGMVDAEVLLVSAFDTARFRWKEGGWDWAWREAQWLRTEYDYDPTPHHWAELMDDHCEYWDPPPKAGRYKCSEDGCKERGRFGLRYRNDLISYVGESTYTEWVTGDCITDRMFLDQAAGTVAGPYRGPLGWYLTRVNKRTPPSRPLRLSDEHHMRLLKDDYLRWSFIQYSKEAVAQADIRGWKPQ